jgi:hypothetical protein
MGYGRPPMRRADRPGVSDRKFQLGVTEEKTPDMPEYLGLFDEATSQRDR